MAVPEMAVVSTREVYMASMSIPDVRTGSMSNHEVSRREVSRRERCGHSVSTSDVSTTAPHRRQRDMIFRSESPRLVSLRDDLRAVTVLNAILRVELPGDLVRRTPNHWVRTKCNHLIARIDAYHLEWKIIEMAQLPPVLDTRNEMRA